jgi:hypothetical protein
MTFLRTLIVVVHFAVVAAFVTLQSPQKLAPHHTVMQFKFLKEMGLEKPSWLPDFGGKKEEEAAPEEEVTAEAPEAEAAPAEE